MKTHSRKYTHMALLFIETKRADGRIDVRWSQVFVGKKAECEFFAAALTHAICEIGVARDIRVKVQSAKEFLVY